MESEADRPFTFNQTKTKTKTKTVRPVGTARGDGGHWPRSGAGESGLAGPDALQAPGEEHRGARAGVPGTVDGTIGSSISQHRRLHSIRFESTMLIEA